MKFLTQMTFLSDPPSGRLKELWSQFFPFERSSLLRAYNYVIRSFWVKTVSRNISRRRKRTEIEGVNELALAQGDTKNIMSRWVNILEKREPPSGSHVIFLFKNRGNFPIQDSENRRSMTQNWNILTKSARFSLFLIRKELNWDDQTELWLVSGICSDYRFWAVFCHLQHFIFQPFLILNLQKKRNYAPFEKMCFFRSSRSREDPRYGENKDNFNKLNWSTGKSFI